MVAEITVVTTSWRLPDTYIFGVQAGAWYPFAYPEAPLLWRSKDHHWTAVECCIGWLTSLLCHLSLHGSPAQSCHTAHCKSRSHELMFILTCWLVCELVFSDILPLFWNHIYDLTSEEQQQYFLFSQYSESPCVTLQSTCQRALEQDT